MRPALPKLGMGCPVRASSAMRNALPVPMKMRASRPSLQWATPRCTQPWLGGVPSFQTSGSCVQSVCPVAASMAATWLSDVLT